MFYRIFLGEAGSSREISIEDGIDEPNIWVAFAQGRLDHVFDGLVCFGDEVDGCEEDVLERLLSNNLYVNVYRRTSLDSTLNYSFSIMTSWKLSQP